MKKKNFIIGFILGLFFCFVFNFILSSNLLAFDKEVNIDSKIKKIISIIDRHYINDYDKKNAGENLYNTFLNSLGDPYTSYMNENIFSNFMQQTEGSYVGIGAILTIDPEDKKITIINIYENSPAEKSGLLSGDKILQLDKKIVTQENFDETVNNLKGKTNTQVCLKIYRPSENKILDIFITREEINIPTVKGKIFESNIGYLRITNFDRNTHQQFMDEYNNISKNNVTSLIIDLRNNPGGLLDSVIKIADEIVPKGTILYTEDKSKNKRYFYSDDKYINMPIVVLVNKNSASASEVLSGAVKDLKRGILVGETTYGKGLVQNLFPLGDGSAIKVTIAKYYTPSGVCIDGKGIVPDYKIRMDNDLSSKISQLNLEQDLQLQKAIDLLNK
ncbi:MAG: S41 family peptidase [Clostridiales bacterium]|nr:S41 family peptidase [Clostridiales bacterium]